MVELHTRARSLTTAEAEANCHRSVAAVRVHSVNGRTHSGGRGGGGGGNMRSQTLFVVVIFSARQILTRRFDARALLACFQLP